MTGRRRIAGTIGVTDELVGLTDVSEDRRVPVAVEVELL